MSAQLDLTGAEHPLQKPELTERQQFALDTLRGLEAGQAVEIGQALHARRGKHTPDQVCSWCSQEGLSVLRALKKRGLVRQRRGGVFEPLEGADRSRVPRAESVAPSSGPLGGGPATAGSDAVSTNDGAAPSSQTDVIPW